jgi:hypothetical protein
LTETDIIEKRPDPDILIADPDHLRNNITHTEIVTDHLLRVDDIKGENRMTDRLGVIIAGVKDKT